jgi:N-ethylmaleimide reductase
MAGGTDKVAEGQPSTSKLFRPLYQGQIIAAGGFDRAGAEEFVSEDLADAIAFGRLFISNPDLPERLLAHAPLTPYDRKTFYGGDAKGYVDYPTMN